MRHLLFAVLLVASGSVIARSGDSPFSPHPSEQRTPGARSQLQIRKALVREKMRLSVGPALAAGRVDAWLVIDRENHPDPLHEQLGGAYSGAGAAFIFCRRGDTIDRVFIGSPQPADSAIENAYDVKDYGAATLDAVIHHARQLLEERQPTRIAINVSESLPVADGLAAGVRDQLTRGLGPFRDRLVSADEVVHAFRAARTPLETEWQTWLQERTADWQATALAGVRPLRTTVLDLVCQLEDRSTAMGLSPAPDHGRFPLIVWFGDRTAMAGLPNFGADHPLLAKEGDARNFLIRRGDLVTLDGGLAFMGLVSDMKRSAYALREGEAAIPDTLRHAWRLTLKMAGLYAARMRDGAFGDEIWHGLVDDARAAGIEMRAGGPAPSATAGPVQSSVYGHATGNAVHDIGARIVPPPTVSDPGPRLPLRNGEWVSIEFHMVVPATDAPRGAWYTRFEQTAQVGPTGASWLVPIQHELIVAGRRTARSAK